MAELLSEACVDGSNNERSDSPSVGEIQTPPCSTPWLPLALLGILCLVLWGGTCGLWDLRGPDEGRYVQISKELLGKSNWFCLTLWGEPYDQKPPLAFWPMAAMLKLTGGAVTSWAVRFPAVLAAMLTVLLTYGLGRRVAGAAGGLASALILMALPLYGDNVPQAELNVPFTFWITCTLALWLTSPSYGEERMSLPRALGFWLALAGAFFVKGPLAFLVVLCVLGCEAWARRSKKPLLSVRPLLGISLLALLLAGWFYAETLAYGAEFVKCQVTGETVNRFVKGAHVQPFWYYIPQALTGFAPWIYFAFAAGVILWRQRKSALAATLRPYASWVVLPFLILCAASGKRANYMLPLTPAMAVLAGWMVAESLKCKRERPRLARLAWAVTALLGVAALGAAVALHVKPALGGSWDLAAPQWVLVVWGVLGAALLISALVLWKSKDGQLAFYWTAGLILVLNFSASFTLKPLQDRVQSTRQFASLVSQLGSARVGGIGDGDDPYFHTYGSYAVEPIRRLPGSGDFSSFPNVLVLDAIASKKMGEKLEAQGYHVAFDAKAAKKPLEVYVRGEAKSPAK